VAGRLLCGAAGRFAGLASIPNNPIDAAIAEVERVAKRGGVRGLDIANSADLKPLWDPHWNPLWEVVNASGLPLHFHTVGGYVPDHIRKMILIGSDPTRASAADAPKVELPVARAAFAVNITAFQINMANVLTSLIFSGVLERFPRIRLVLGESGIGWIPYIIWRMDAEWEDQFKDLSLKMPPSEYWKRQCWATYQTDPSASSCSTSWAPTRSCGARTSRIPTGCGRLERVHRAGARASAGRRAAEDRLRERRAPLRIFAGLSTSIEGHRDGDGRPR
jgi:predicted TIM-barrel fold metal-dependent hydrolase